MGEVPLHTPLQVQSTVRGVLTGYDRGALTDRQALCVGPNSLSVWIWTEARRNPATSNAKQGSRTRRFGPTLRAGVHTGDDLRALAKRHI